VLGLFAATGTTDLAQLLLDLLVVVVAAKLASEVCERVRVPTVVGEIVAGILVGPSVLGFVELNGARGISLEMIAEIGVLLLLVEVGMEMDLAGLGRVGRASLLVALVGVVVPFTAGTLAGLGFGENADTSIFLGAALTATSVGITARVLGDLRALATTEARVILGAAVADDVIGLIILTVVVKVVTGDAVTTATVVSTTAIALGFLVLAGTVALLAVPPALDAIHRWSRSGTTLTVASLALVLALATLADAANLAFIIGAFIAGLALGRSRHQAQVASDLNSVGTFFIPVFFLLIGVNADLDAMFRPSVLAVAGVLTIVAVVGKLVSAIGAVRLHADRLMIGIGMIPRGEVGLIFASIGLSEGVLDSELYGALLVVVLLSTLATPPVLRWRINATGAAELARALDEETTEEPEQGWISVDDGRITLAGKPPLAATAPIALAAAVAARDAVPSDHLLAWFGDRRAAPLTWTAAHTDHLLDVLRTGDARSVRFLDVTGVLERAVPDLAAALERRRSDPGELDPARVLRFPTVARAAELLELPQRDPRDRHVGPPANGSRGVLLAALVIDVLGPDADRQAAASLLRQLAVAAPDRVERSLEAAALLRATAADVDSYDQEEIRKLAAHIGSPALATDAYLVALTQPSSERHREALDEVREHVDDLLAHPEQLGEQADSLAEARRKAAEALSTEPGTIARLRTASVNQLLAHEPDELARQARLIEPLPGRGVVRVAVSPDPRPDHWSIDVACRDVDGLLARLSRTLTAAGCNIVSATLATWDDGGVVDTFVVRSAVRPRARALAEAFEAALRHKVVLEPVPGLDVTFDNTALPWHTSATVTGQDRPGVLAALAAAFAAAGVVVHRARVTTAGTDVVDRFALSDRHGRKLDAAAVERVRRALAGERPRRRLMRALG
jgi:Kef-type K+ transport system membrane component KefB/glycine cleavage system regulatory protein